VLKSFVIPAQTTGTWPTGNVLGAILYVCLCSGTTGQGAAGWSSTSGLYTTANQFNLFATNGNTFDLFDVGLYDGSALPDFVVPPVAQTVQACQRYFFNAGLTMRFTAGAAGAFLAQQFTYPNPMRTTPTMALDGTSRSNLATLSFPQVSGYGAMTSTGVFISSTNPGDCYIFNENMTGSARMW
jgi:hypothetical protein